MKEKPLVSVIVPIYKVEQYIVKSVESIINQTYRNLEIILVDDGSPDACGDIADEFAGKDARIRVIHKKNGGLSDARNAGLKVASGEYIYFFDSDDLVDIKLLETALQPYLTTQTDLVCFNYVTVDEISGDEKKLRSGPKNTDGEENGRICPSENTWDTEWGTVSGISYTGQTLSGNMK